MEKVETQPVKAKNLAVEISGKSIRVASVEVDGDQLFFIQTHGSIRPQLEYQKGFNRPIVKIFIDNTSHAAFEVENFENATVNGVQVHTGDEAYNEILKCANEILKCANE